jgi:hypothetical protein
MFIMLPGFYGSNMDMVWDGNFVTLKATGLNHAEYPIMSVSWHPWHSTDSGFFPG